MNKNIMLTIIMIIFVVLSFTGCNHNTSPNLKLNAIYVYKSNKSEVQIELYKDHTMYFKYIPNSYNAPEYYRGTFSIDGNVLTVNLTPDEENSENSVIKNGSELTYTIISDTEFKDDNGKKIKYSNTAEKIAYATIIILGENSNDDTPITKQTIEQNEKLIDTYEALMNSKAIKNVIEEKYGTVNNVEFKTIEDADMIKVIYVCDEHTDEECKQILQELLSEFSTKIKEIYNLKDIYIIDNPEISSRAIE